MIDLDLPLARADEAFDRDGRLLSAAHGARVGEVLAALVAEAAADSELAAAA